jgi:single-stranded DNA-binding protein
MKQYDNTNRGTLGKNQRREKDTHPEYTGQIDIEGVGYWISAWVKEGQGGKFFSLSVKRKEQSSASAPRAPAPAPRPSSGFDDMDDDIPF